MPFSVLATIVLVMLTNRGGAFGGGSLPLWNSAQLGFSEQWFGETRLSKTHHDSDYFFYPNFRVMV